MQDSGGSETAATRMVRMFRLFRFFRLLRIVRRASRESHPGLTGELQIYGIFGRTLNYLSLAFTESAQLPNEMIASPCFRL